LYYETLGCYFLAQKKREAREKELALVYAVNNKPAAKISGRKNILI
jgi:hypothetical protein